MHCVYQVIGLQGIHKPNPKLNLFTLDTQQKRLSFSQSFNKDIAPGAFP